MTAAVIGALRVSLGLDTAQFDQGTKKAKSGLNRMSGAFDKASGRIESKAQELTGSLGALGEAMAGLGPIGLAAAAGIGATAIAFVKINELARQSITNLTNLSQTADLLQVSTDQLQELRYAAAQLGVETQDLDDAWREWTLRVGEAQAGEGELLELLERYNVAIRDQHGNNRTATAIFRDLADVTSKVRDKQEQLRIADLAGGDALQRLVQLLAQGSKGLDENARAARENGAVVDREIIKRSAEAGREMRILEQQQAAALDRIGAVFSEAALFWEQSKTEILTITADVAEALDEIEPIAKRLYQLMDPVRAVRSNLTTLSNVLGGGSSPPVVAPGITVTPPQPGVPIPRRRADEPSSSQYRTDQAKAATDAERERNRVMAEGARITEQLYTPTERYAATIQKLHSLLAEGAISQETFNRAEAAAAEQVMAEGKATRDSMRTATEEYADEMARLNRLLNEGTISEETFRRAAKEARETLDEADTATKRLSDTMSDELGGAIKGLIQGTQTFEDVMLSALTRIGEALIDLGLKGAGIGGGGGGLGGGLIGSIFSGIGGLFGGGSSFGGASLLASGVPASQSLGLFGFREGGQFTVGGYGGPDSEIVAFKASPGETVSVGSGAVGGGGGVGAIRVDVSGANGDAEIERRVRAGVAAGLAAYDERLPGRILDINRRNF